MTASFAARRVLPRRVTADHLGRFPTTGLHHRRQLNPLGCCHILRRANPRAVAGNPAEPILWYASRLKALTSQLDPIF
jgi:hypothetical protein